MQTVIVPVDFSETSLNAARYAVRLLTGHYGLNMILYHMFEKQDQENEVVSKLEKLKIDLRETGIVKTEVFVEKGEDFIDELEKLARHRQADLVVMGITGRSSIGQSFIGSNALAMLKTKVCPVFIVPPDAAYRDVKNVLMATDFRNVKDSTPSAPIRKILKAFHPKLHVVNIDTEFYVALSDEMLAEKDKLKEMFHDLNPEFYFWGLPDVNEAISQFAKDKNADLIVIIHKEQSIFTKLFVKSHTKKLIYESSLPVLAVHE
jgi:nucleotide-binding universal stress UspA family protein